MRLADYIESNRQRVIDRWKKLVIERLSLDLEHSQLVNELPEFLNELTAVAREPARCWPNLESARNHGRQRMRNGVDIGSLTVEMALVAEALIGLMVAEDGYNLDCEELQLLTRVIGQATAASVNAYVALRDKQLANQAAQHFSFIAHEIRNPLHNARVAAALTVSGRLEVRKQSFERLERALTQLSDLVDSSLIQARLYGEPSLNVERHDIVEIMETAREGVIAHAEARGLTVAIEAERFEIDADRKLLLSALTNLLQNAVKFTHDCSTLTLRARMVEGRALLEVEDQCGGMPEGLPERLFQPFVQGGADKSGFGLGLTIVKQAVDAHHGAVRVIDHPGSGCTFVLDLPLRQAP